MSDDADARDSFELFDARLQPGGMQPVPVVDVNLDDPPAVRWAWVASYAQHFNAARQLILGEIGIEADAPTPLWVRAGARVILSAVPSAMRVELEACSAVCGVPASELALLNYLYELKAKCSSFVVARHDGRPLHARTLDWPGCAVLCECTVRLRFLRGGSLLYESLTWPGYLGVMTACAPGRFSLSFNFRADERAQLPWELPGEGAAHTIVSEVLRRGVAMLGSLTGRCRSVGFAVRQLLEEEEPALVSFDGALERLSRVALVAPVYFTLCGTNPGEGAVLVRGPAPIPSPAAADDGEGWRVRRLSDPAVTCNGLLYQANADLAVSAGAAALAALKEEEEGGFVSWDRIRKAQRLARKYGPVYDLADVVDMLTAPPIANEITIFSCVLDPSGTSGRAVHCGRHCEFEEVYYDDEYHDIEVKLPTRRAGSSWRGRIGGRGSCAVGRGRGRGRGIAKKRRGRG